MLQCIPVWCLARLGNDGGTVTTGMTGIAKGAHRCGYAWQEKEVGVAWELVGLAIRQVAVAVNGGMEYDGREAGIGASAGKEGDMGRSGQIGGGGKREVLM
jgi:hypothetical protein